MDKVFNFSEFVILFIPMALILLNSRRLKEYFKINYPKEYKINCFEPEGYIVNNIGPNLFVISSDAKDIAKIDK